MRLVISTGWKREAVIRLDERVVVQESFKEMVTSTKPQNELSLINS